MSLIINVPRGMNRIVTSVQRRLRLVFFGTPQFAVPSLRRLCTDGWPIEAVVTAPDKPVGRHGVLAPSAVKIAALELGIPVHTPATLKDENFWRMFSDMRPDLCIVVAYGKLIPKRYLDEPRLGFLNVHPSLLPSYRGPSPIQSAILDGAPQTGVSIILLDEEMDHGPIIARKRWAIPSGFDARACETELADVGAHLLVDSIPGYAEGSLVPQPQDHTTATFTKKFTREDGRLRWDQPLRAIYDRIRALGAEPGTWTMWNGMVLNIIAAHPSPSGSARIGNVVRAESDISIGCQDGLLVVELVQPEGGKVMDARAFVNGHPEFIGSEVV